MLSWHKSKNSTGIKQVTKTLASKFVNYHDCDLCNIRLIVRKFQSRLSYFLFFLFFIISFLISLLSYSSVFLFSSLDLVKRL